MISHGGCAIPAGGFQGPNARKGGRLRVYGVTTDLGPVSDLSSNGMRVTVRSKPALHESMSLSVSAEGVQAEVEARVVWVQRRGLRRYEVGLEFINVCDERRAQIMELVRTGIATVGFARGVA